MLAIAIALANELAAIAPQAIQAGISIAGLWTQVRAALDATAAPDDAAWAKADADVNALKARALDPATDDQ
jgi:hypothetical protein